MAELRVEHRAEQRERAERFLLELRHEAHRMLPPDHAEQVVAEAQWHLEESVYSGAMSGKSPDAAARDAVAGFGPPRRFVRRVADAATDSRAARAARAVALGLGLFLLIGLPVGFYLHLPFFFWESGQGIVFVALLLFAIVSFVGRRALTRLLLIPGVLLVVSLSAFFAVDSYTITEDNLTARESRMFPHELKRLELEKLRLRLQRDILQEEKSLLERGVHAAVRGGRIPDFLNVGGAMLVPRSFAPQNFVWREETPLKWADSPYGFAFHPLDVPQGALVSDAAFLRRYKRELMEGRLSQSPTARDAAAGWGVWREIGPIWLRGRTVALETVNRQIDVRENAPPLPPGFDGAAAFDAARLLTIALLMIVGTNLAATRASEICVYRWRRWLWRLRTA